MHAFTEQRTLTQVTLLLAQQAVNVQWTNQVLKDGVVISETFERKAYSKEQAAGFVAEVGATADVLAQLGWA